MIIILLILIVLILLFGAGAIKGWLRGFALHLLAALIFVAIFSLAASWLGMTEALVALFVLSLLLFPLKHTFGPEADERNSKQRHCESEQRRNAAKSAWEKWNEDRASEKAEPIRMSDISLSKKEKKRRKDEYLDRRS